jgi:hypothetical protein
LREENAQRIGLVRLEYKKRITRGNVPALDQGLFPSSKCRNQNVRMWVDAVNRRVFLRRGYGLAWGGFTPNRSTGKTRMREPSF